VFENELVKNAKKTWDVTVKPTKTFGNKIYSLIGIGYADYFRTDLDPKKTEIVEVGEDKKAVKIYATYYFGHDY